MGNPRAPLFEAVRRHTLVRAKPELDRGASNVVYERLFAVEVASHDQVRLQEPGVLGNFVPALPPAELPPVAHLPELRFALGEPELDTTSIDNAAFALEERSYFVRRVGSDGFRIGYQPTLKKVVSDRRASLDYETEVKPAMRQCVEEQFRRGASVPVVAFPLDSGDIPDSPRLMLVVADPEWEWSLSGPWRGEIARWTSNRGTSPRLYPGALVWCVKKPGRELRDKVELVLAWRRVAREVADGSLGGEFDRGDRADLQGKVRDAEEAVKEEVWGVYRFVVVADRAGADGLKVIDLGAGHSSSGGTMCGRVLAALKSEALLNESVGVGYLERNWPPALRESGAWPLASLRQSFLNGSLTRLVDPDAVLKAKIVEFVRQGDFGLASGQRPGGGFERVWFEEVVGRDEVEFSPGVFLLRKEVAATLKSGAPLQPVPAQPPEPAPPSPSAPGAPPPAVGSAAPTASAPAVGTCTLRLLGCVPPEMWNRLGTRILPRLRGEGELRIDASFEAVVAADRKGLLADELRHALQELGVDGVMRVE